MGEFIIGLPLGVDNSCPRVGAPLASPCEESAEWVILDTMAGDNSFQFQPGARLTQSPRGSVCGTRAETAKGVPVSLKFLSCILTVATLTASSAVLAKEPSDTSAVAQSPPARRYTAEESAALGAAAQRRAEAQQRGWERRLEKISASICHGC